MYFTINFDGEKRLFILVKRVSNLYEIAMSLINKKKRQIHRAFVFKTFPYFIVNFISIFLFIDLLTEFHW